MPCLPGFCPVMKPVHDTLEMVGIEERMGAVVPAGSSAASRGITPRAVRSCTSGSPTPSRPITATRDLVSGRDGKRACGVRESCEGRAVAEDECAADVKSDPWSVLVLDPPFSSHTLPHRDAGPAAVAGDAPACPSCLLQGHS